MSAPPQVRALDLVFAALRTVLGDQVPLSAGTELFELRGFDSITLAALVDALEACLDESLPDELLTPDVFATPAQIADRLIGPAQRGGRA